MDCPYKFASRIADSVSCSPNTSEESAERVGLFREITGRVSVTCAVVERISPGKKLSIEDAVDVAGRAIEWVYRRLQIAASIVSVRGDIVACVGRGQDFAEDVVSEPRHVVERIGNAGAMIVTVVGISRRLAQRVRLSQDVVVGVVSESRHAMLSTKTSNSRLGFKLI